MFLAFIIIDTNIHSQQYGGGLRWDWSHSGTPDGPWFLGDSNSIPIAESDGSGKIRPVDPDWKGP